MSMLLRFFRIRTFKHMFETNRSKSKNKFVRFSDQKTKNSGRLKTGHSFWILDRFFCIKIYYRQARAVVAAVAAAAAAARGSCNAPSHHADRLPH